MSRGPLQANELLALATAAGVSCRTLSRAKRDLGIKSTQEGAGWVWSLPSSVSPEAPRSAAARPVTAVPAAQHARAEAPSPKPEPVTPIPAPELEATGPAEAQAVEAPETDHQQAEAGGPVPTTPTQSPVPGSAGPGTSAGSSAPATRPALRLAEAKPLVDAWYAGLPEPRPPRSATFLKWYAEQPRAAESGAPEPQAPRARSLA